MKNKMEKKIERVPYISKWYKEENDELLHFDFKDENKDITFEEIKHYMDVVSPNEHCDPKFYQPGSDYDIDKYYQAATWTIGYSKPTVQLKYVCNLTQEELTELSIHLLGIRGMAMDIKAFPKRKDFNAYCECIAEKAMEVRKYLFNEDNVRDKAQEYKLKILEEQAKLRKSYEGTLGEHWKELMLLFEIKEKQGLNVVKNMYSNGVLAITTDCKTAAKLAKLIDTLGIDFIKDFIKACEKCED